MQDQPDVVRAFLKGVVGLGDRPPTLPAIFQAGERICNPGPIPDGTPTQRIAVLGATTIDYLCKAVACAVAQEGVLPVLYQAPYGTYIQEILDPASGFHRFGAELAVIAPQWRDMDASTDAALTARVESMVALWSRLAERGVKIVQHTLQAPAERYRGSGERLDPASPGNRIRRLNMMLMEAGQGLVTWVDMDFLAQAIGTRRFASRTFYYTAKLEHDQKWLPDYLPLFRAAWRSANARANKVMVLDLDNTLWGGVIGDDGVDGLVLGPESPAGEAFQDWQRYVKGLGARGVILAVCSKNDPAVAATAFDHPHSVLQRQDFAAFECSWNDKAAALRRIARDLNVGIDSFVFCDDNPAECDLVRQELPEVSVVCLGSDPAAFIDMFDAGCWFDTDRYTTEDMGRAAAYAARASALAEQEQATDLASYLRGLQMKAVLGRPEDADIGRCAQLEQKTNQFNLTTRRYTEAQIRDFMTRDDAVVLAFRLADRFGDHGLTSTLIGFVEGDTLRIDSWLMSCRIFSRSAEPFILRHLIGIAEARGIKRLLGEYLPTAKNGVVADLFPGLGFRPAGGALFARELGAPDDDLVSYIQD